jgi:hypothetical protein
MYCTGSYTSTCQTPRYAANGGKLWIDTCNGSRVSSGHFSTKSINRLIQCIAQSRFHRNSTVAANASLQKSDARWMPDGDTSGASGFQIFLTDTFGRHHHEKFHRSSLASLLKPDVCTSRYAGASKAASGSFPPAINPYCCCCPTVCDCASRGEGRRMFPSIARDQLLKPQLGSCRARPDHNAFQRTASGF